MKTRQGNNMTYHTDAVEGKNPNPFVSQFRIMLGTCITILGFLLTLMHSGKITFLYFKRIQKVLTKTIAQIRMFRNQIYMVKMNIEIVKVS